MTHSVISLGKAFPLDSLQRAAVSPVGKKTIENVLQMLQVLKMSTWISVTHLPNETQFLTNEGTEIYRPVTENQVVKMSTSFFRNASRPVENQVAKRTT